MEMETSTRPFNAKIRSVPFYRAIGNIPEGADQLSRNKK